MWVPLKKFIKKNLIEKHVYLIGKLELDPCGRNDSCISHILLLFRVIYIFIKCVLEQLCNYTKRLDGYIYINIHCWVKFILTFLSYLIV